MRTALVLLFLLALAAVPGSVVPQENIDAIAVNGWQADHPRLTPIYEALGLFSVYGSVWFAAIYILLMISLVGCVVPRLRVYWRAMRARPPRAPRNLARLPQSRTFELDGEPAAVLERAVSVLRGRRYRVEVDGDAVAGERGYLREAGNLLFHSSVLLVLVAFAAGQLFGYKGGVITVVGQGFSNSLTQYDDFAPGSLFDPQDLTPLNLTVEDFDVDFLTSGPQMGQPRDFRAKVRYSATPGAPEKTQEVAVNHPLTLDGVSVFLVGHGYAPVVTVKDGNGDVAFSGPAVFLPQDSSFASFGVIKVPDAAPTQLGFEGLFLPTYGFTMARGPFSQFPDALDPVLSLVPYSGDLGLDDGKPQSVYQLDKDRLKPFKSKDASRGAAARIKLSPGDEVQLPQGAGSIRFDGVQRWVKLQVSDSPGKGWALFGVILGILGLMGSLFIRPRRAWVRVRPAGPAGPGGSGRRRTVVELAGLDRSSGGDLGDEIDELERRLRGGAAGEHAQSPGGPDVPDVSGSDVPNDNDAPNHEERS
ncbi:cytochrome c biogenesis protein ResB [Nocardioides mesophilus]|uniref:Cytochrome c biogenesis protein ResB n=2 Tax=Nocardioides mesophilus TaxID=433659 RepID=A0A7G9RHC2_9ACTN|nr:cytochrome c biogenesis protein ResB [Nocardioides mesophilus]